MTTEGGRYSRNEALFGHKGQEKIFASHVAIVGLGGLGSHVAQQLVYLGVSNLVLIDPDVVTPSSLNRLVGANAADATEQTAKAVVVAEACRRVLPGCRARPVVDRLDSAGALGSLDECSSVFGCLDNDSARLDLIQACSSSRIPFFDLASDTGATGADLWYGGRVLFSGRGERCPVCMDLLDQNELARSGLTEPQREVDRRIYGIPAEDLAETGPAVVSINGVVASLAVTEWMAWTTGLREPAAFLEYRGASGTVFSGRDAPRENCYYCVQWRHADAHAVSQPG